MAVIGSLLKNLRAGEDNLAWNLPNLAGPDSLTVTSVFAEGAAIPAEYAGMRGAISPELAWTARPAGTAQLLVVVQDTDSPGKSPFVHLVALVDAAADGVPRGALSAGSPGAGVQLLRSGMGTGYIGPAPIKGHGPHHYFFQVFALAAPVTGADGVKPGALLASVAGPVLGRGRLTGSYER
jgi:phosphatidylethanolamine-binding protein (PEBP) family uncharacterized protein